MDMLRITARWTGFPGAPGYSNFFFAGGGGFIGDHNQVAQRVMGAFDEIRVLLTGGTSISLLPEAAVVDSDTGMVSELRALDPIAPVEGTSSATYAGPAGAVVNWRTSDLRNGRRIRGRTFLVPLNSNAYDDSGTLSVVALQDIGNFADAMRATDIDSELGVWSRPVGGTGGVFATVDAHNVPDMVAVLRSRRD